MRFTLPLILAGVLSALPGCGQKGPLVLPDAQHPHKKIGIGRPASQQPPPPAPGALPPAPAAGTDASGTAAAPQP